ncbi:lysoplasmalogenase [Lysobacter solisilvae (ex Woo and Kim 2020)]|nr:lysoplasmalogenase [Lysobacter terrestris]
MAAVTVVALLAIAGAIAPDLRGLHYACKPLATLLVAAMVLRASWCRGRYRSAVLVGLLLSTLGDVFLMLPPAPQGPDWFVFGLASFLFAHVAYLVAFCSRAPLFAKRWPFAVYAVVALGVSMVLWPHLPGELRPPVAIYVLLLAAMAAQAAAVWALLRDRGSALAALGGAFFVASDATLAIDRFVAPVPAAIVLVLVTYWIAQLLIGLSVRSR